MKAVIFDMFETLVTHYNSPLYFGNEIAEDLPIEKSKFLEEWNRYEDDRTLGKIGLEEVLYKILLKNNVDRTELIELVVKKRKEAKKKCFDNISNEILEMLKTLKKENIKVGLISNCFSEEVDVIKQSELYEYFDVVCLSYELGLKKPDPRIFKKCIRELHVHESECLYVGDGGSDELAAASSVGMKTMQAIWFINEQSQQAKVKEEYAHLIKPADVIRVLKLNKSTGY